MNPWVIVLLAGLAIYAAVRNYRRYLIIKSTPAEVIRSASQGYSRITGHVSAIAEAELTAPLSMEPCVWYHYRIEEKSGKNNRTIEKGTSNQSFLLDDGTGQCVIDPENAEVTQVVSERWTGSPPPGKKDDRGFLKIFSQRTYVETRIPVGHFINVIGLYKTLRAPCNSESLHGDVTALLANWKSNYHQLLEEFDSNKDGKIDEQEWQAVIKKAEQEIAKTHQAQQQQEPLNFMMATKDRHRPFVISCRTQEKLAKFYHHSAILSLLAFIGLTLWAMSQFNLI